MKNGLDLWNCRQFGDNWYLTVQLFGKRCDVFDGDVAEDGTVEVGDHVPVAVIPGKVLKSIVYLFYIVWKGWRL